MARCLLDPFGGLLLGRAPQMIPKILPIFAYGISLNISWCSPHVPKLHLPSSTCDPSALPLGPRAGGRTSALPSRPLLRNRADLLRSKPEQFGWGKGMPVCAGFQSHLACKPPYIYINHIKSALDSLHLGASRWATIHLTGGFKSS